MTQTSRQRWMQLLAEAEVQGLRSAFERLEKPVASTFLIKPETGMVMVQGKADGTGTAFCIGEMTVTRCMVQVMDGIQGYAMVPGSDPDHARLAALFDAAFALITDTSSSIALNRFNPGTVICPDRSTTLVIQHVRHG